MLLLRHGAKRDLQDDNDETPLFLAVKNGQYEMAKLLLENLANTNIPNDMNQMPRDIAAERRHSNIVELLDNFRLQPLTSVTSCQASDVVLPTYVQHIVKKKLKTVTAKAPDVKNSDFRTSENLISESSDRSTNFVFARKFPESGNNVQKLDMQPIGHSNDSGVSNVDRNEASRRKAAKSVREMRTVRGNSAENVKYPKKKTDSVASVRERRNSHQKSPAGCRLGRKGSSDTSCLQNVGFTESQIVALHGKEFLSCALEGELGHKSKNWGQQSGFDENRNVSFESQMSHGAPTGQDGASWSGTLSPPDSTCCISPNVGSPESSLSTLVSNVQSTRVGCRSVAHVVFHSNASSSYDADDVRSLFGADVSLQRTTLGVPSLIVNQCECPNSKKDCMQSESFSKIGKPGLYNLQRMTGNPLAGTGIIQDSVHLLNAPVQCHVINTVTFDCLTPSPDDSLSFQLE